MWWWLLCTTRSSAITLLIWIWVYKVKVCMYKYALISSRNVQITLKWTVGIWPRFLTAVTLDYALARSHHLNQCYILNYKSTNTILQLEFKRKSNKFTVWMSPQSWFRDKWIIHSWHVVSCSNNTTQNLFRLDSAIGIGRQIISD